MYTLISTFQQYFQSVTRTCVVLVVHALSMLEHTCVSVEGDTPGPSVLKVHIVSILFNLSLYIHIHTCNQILKLHA